MAQVIAVAQGLSLAWELLHDTDVVKNFKKGVLALARCIKNPTTVAWIAAEVWVLDPAQSSRSKNLVLLPAAVWVTAVAQISPQPGKVHMSKVRP